MTTAFVEWNLTGTGYECRVWLDIDEGAPEFECRQGNHPGCSTTELPPDHPRRVKDATLRKFAIQTAGELAKEYEIPPSRVFHDADTEKQMIEQSKEVLA